MKQLSIPARASALLLSALLLGGCSLFGDDDELLVKELVEFTPTITPKILWEVDAGDGIDKHFSRLSPTVSGDLVIAADRVGRVSAFNRDSGAQQWQVDLRTLLGGNSGSFLGGGDNLRISGGLSSNNQHVVFGTERGLLVALQVSDGSLVWSTKVRGEILSAPAIGDGKVVIKTAAGDVIGFSESSGEQVWSVATEVPALSLRGTSAPTIANGGALFGTGNGKLSVAVLDNGLQAWEARLAVPKGATELQRLSDSDSTPLVLGNVVYSIAFNGQLTAVELSTGRVVWAREYSSYQNIAIASGRVFVADVNDSVHGIELSGGIEQWSNTDLTGRRITAPAVIGGNVVVGDEYGYLHFMNMATGSMSGRLEVGSDVYAAAVVAGDTLYVQTRDGTLLAVRI